MPAWHDEAVRARAVARVRGCVEAAGWRVLGVVPSPIAGGDTAASLASDGWVSSERQFDSPSTFSAEAWFNTSYNGGRIIGFSGARDGWSNVEWLPMHLSLIERLSAQRTFSYVFDATLPIANLVRAVAEVMTDQRR